MRTTKINRETDVLENQIQLDRDLDELNMSALHRQYMTAAANALSLLSPIPVMVKHIGEYRKYPEGLEFPVTEVP